MIISPYNINGDDENREYFLETWEYLFIEIRGRRELTNWIANVCRKRNRIIKTSISKSNTVVAAVVLVPGAGEVEEPAGGGEDDEGDLGVAEDGELLRLLEQPPPPLRERHLPRRRVVDLPNLYLLPRHYSNNNNSSSSSSSAASKPPIFIFQISSK